ncbi:hypothetical protein HPP92_019647 [Vanilla planifolia]|uniref:Bulb-type lectin domain-containing protein n=1 Tax=Vanilla planifolia TaxID=51239 RepID=A0A835QAQ1_VANPL|nr:hypothetical protein HPP92_019647 [Vanilla planifolia]
MLHLSVFVFLAAFHYHLGHAEFHFDYPTASLSTTWINNPALTPNMADYIHGEKVRILLLRGGGGPRFACVIWSANRDHLVGENATLRLTADGDLILRDSDGSSVWSTVTANRSVSNITLTHSGNLILVNRRNQSVWSSFEHPTDTLVSGQGLLVGQSLTSNYTASNSTRIRYSMSLRLQSVFAYIDSNPPQAYSKLSLKHLNPKAIRHGRNLTLNNGHLYWPDGVRTDFGGYGIWVVQFMRLEFDGRLRIYGIGPNSIPGVTVLLDYTNFDLDFCDYPMVCGQYGVCSDGQCSCPKNASDGDDSFFRPISWGLLNPGCAPVNPISCESSINHQLLPLGNVSYFNYVDDDAAALRETEEERCKQTCLTNCSCKAALFRGAVPRKKRRLLPHRPILWEKIGNGCSHCIGGHR